MFLGVAETIVGSLLFYGVDIVLCLFNLSYCVTLVIALVLKIPTNHQLVR